MILIIFFISFLFSEDLLHLSTKEPFLEYKNGKTFQAKRIDGRVDIDGILNDITWEGMHNATSYTDIQNEGYDKLSSELYLSQFIQQFPSNLSSPRFNTIVSIQYDDENIYVAAKLFDSSPDSIVQRLSRKDDIDPWLSDWFSIEFDSNHDHYSAFRFVVNASGVQLDGITYGDSEFDLEFNPVWFSAVDINVDSWTVEMKIPFKMLSITKLEVPWGLNINRYVYRYNEVSRWVVYPEEISAGVAGYGHIFGFKGIQLKKSIEFKPYMLSGRLKDRFSLLEDPGIYSDIHTFEGNKNKIDRLGIDIKYRLSSSSSMDFSINPDFSMVEMDPELINLTYYEVFLPDKRVFFNSTDSFFDMPISVFYSRRIASNHNGDNIYKVDNAIKLTGDMERGVEYAFISANLVPIEKASNSIRQNHLVGRIKKSYFEGRSIAGLTYTQFSDNLDAKTSEIYSFDNLSYFFEKQLLVDIQTVKSFNSNDDTWHENQSLNGAKEGSGSSISLGYRPSYSFGINLDAEVYDNNFDISDNGYLYRNDLRNFLFNPEFEMRDPLFNLRSVQIGLYRGYATNYDSDLIIDDYFGSSIRLETNGLSYFTCSFYIYDEHYDDYYTYDHELKKYGPPFLLPKFYRSSIEFSSNEIADFSFDLGLEYTESEIHNRNPFNSNDNFFGFNLRLNSNVKLFSFRNLSLGYQLRLSSQAYYFLEIIEDEFDSPHYIFSNRDAWSHRYDLRMEEYFTNKLSLQVFCEYFQVYNLYSNFTEFNSNNRWPQESNFIEGYTDSQGNIIYPLYTDGNLEPIIDVDGEEMVALQEVNPNYYVGFYPRYSNLNLNLSVKWEFSPKSNLYAILRISKSVNGKLFDSIGDFFSYSNEDEWVERYYSSSFYIKFNHWFSI